MQLSEQEIIRRKSLEEFEKLGINPYPAELFDVNASATEILENYERHKSDYRQISIAGRIMSRRIMGNASFAELQDETGRIQIYIRRDDICPTDDKNLYNIVFKKLLDIGDIIGVKGFGFTTQTGEISIHVVGLSVLSKSLRPIPVVKDTTDEHGLDKSCQAMAQGPNRLERGLAYSKRLVEAYSATHKVVRVPGCGHSAVCVFAGPAGVQAVFGAAR
jgi:lysyl-tRNA synthetase class 2